MHAFATTVVTSLAFLSLPFFSAGNSDVSDDFFAPEGYQSEWVSQETALHGDDSVLEVLPCETVSLNVVFRNTGTKPWQTTGPEAVSFNIYKDPDVRSAPKSFSYKAGERESYFEHATWEKPYRLGTFNTDVIQPGASAMATLRFSVPCDANAGTYREDISLAVGKRWMPSTSKTADALGVAHIWIKFRIAGISTTNPHVDLPEELYLSLLRHVRDYPPEMGTFTINDFRDEQTWGLIGVIANRYKKSPKDGDVGSMQGNRFTILYRKQSGHYVFAYDDDARVLALLGEISPEELSPAARRSLFPAFAGHFVSPVTPQARDLSTQGRTVQAFAIDTSNDPPPGMWYFPFRSGTTFKVTQGYLGQGVYPCKNSRQCSHYKTKALDFVAKEDKTIIAPRSGVVNSIGYNRWNGNYIILDHGSNVYSMYLHLRSGSLVVERGDDVSRGDALGTMGNTGNSTGAHLDFRACRRNYQCNGGATIDTPFVELNGEIPSYSNGKFVYTSGNG